MKAFEDLKGYLTSPPILSKPVDKEELYIYLVIFAYAVSLVLIRVVNGIHKPIYYVSKVLEDAKTKYSDIEKLALTLFMSSKKL